MPVPVARVPSPFAQVAKAIVAAGYHPIPVLPGDKAPGEMSGGRWQLMEGWPKWRDQTPAEFIVKLWSTWDAGNIGIVLGTKITDKLEIIALDFDTDENFLLEIMEAAVPVANVRKRGRRGHTGFYLAPIGTQGRRFRRGKAVIFEILTGNATRQTIIPPSIHRDTQQPYVWLTKGTLADTPPLSLVRLTEDMIDRLVDTLESLEGVEEVRPNRAEMGSDDSPHRQLNNAALAALEAWVPALALHKFKRTSAGYVAVPHWRPSNTGRDLSARSRNLGVATTGIEDFGAGQKYTALDLVMAAANWDLETAFTWLADRLGLSEEGFDLGVPCALSSPHHDLPPHDPETGEIDLPPEPRTEPRTEPQTTPTDLTSVPGLVGEIINWIEATARRPNRMLALGAAITVVGTLVGRRVAGPTLSGTHLYVIALAPSGAGKDHSLRQIDLLLKAANAGHLIGPDDFMSMTAMIGVLQRTPCCLCAMDEFGAYLGRLSHRRASPHEKGMTKVLRMVWGISFRMMRTPEWGAKQSEEIYAPAMSIYGNSTPGEFFASLQGDDVVNGFLNRFLLIEAEKGAEQDPKSDPLEVPASLSRRLVELYARTIAITPADMSRPFDPRPRVMGWGAGAQAEFKLLNQEIEILREDDAMESFYARTVEMAVRLATIRALGQGKDTVDVEDLAWGRAVASASSRQMVDAAGEHMAGNEFAGYANRIVRFMRKKQVPVTRRDILRHLSGELRLRELTEIMDMLVEAGRVVASAREKPIVGRPPTSPIYSLPIKKAAL